jgi:hypothetical protein
MKYLRSALLGLAASAAMVIPAVPAMASGFTTNVPADCVKTLVNAGTTSLTCTNRPADQRWQDHRFCIGVWGLDTDAFGNIVTGNGTSTAVCPPSAKPESLVWFEVVK